MMQHEPTTATGDGRSTKLHCQMDGGFCKKFGQQWKCELRRMDWDGAHVKEWME
jgi:hypothetical protein